MDADFASSKAIFQAVDEVYLTCGNSGGGHTIELPMLHWAR